MSAPQSSTRTGGVIPDWRVVLLLILSSLVMTQPRMGGWNDMSRMAATEAIVEHGTLRIDDTKLGMFHDKVFIDGHFYSDKPVTASLLAVPAYWVVYQLGFELDKGMNLAYYAINVAMMRLAWIVGLIAFYASLAYTGLKPRARTVLMLLLAFCSLHLTWAATFNNHSLAASLLMMGLYALLRIKHEQAGWASALGAGACFGLAAMCDYPTALFGLAFLVYLLIDRTTRHAIPGYALAATAAALPGLIINYQISGSIMPVQINPENFAYEGSPWMDSHTLSGTGVNPITEAVPYGLSMLVGPRGFLWHNPLLWIAIPAQAYVLYRRNELWREAIVVAVCCIAIFVYYSFNTVGYGGYCYSIRWFIPALPMLFLFLYPLFQQSMTPLRKRTLSAFAAAALCISLVGVVNPWSDMSHGAIPFLDNIKWVLSRLS